MCQTRSRLLGYAVQSLEARRLLCTLHDPHGLSGYPLDGGEAPPVQADAEPQSINVLQVPNYNSNPTASRKLYLDFNGHEAIEGWGGWLFGGKNVTPTQAYDIDGNPDAFSAQELANIRQIWQGVAEKFSIFNIDVTTVKPGTINGGHIVIGGNGAWYGSGGGVALRNGWGEEGVTDPVGYNVAFVWGKPADTAYVAEGIAHEAGHLLGLKHQSLNPVATNEYAPGWIMGRGDAGIGRWTSTSVTGGQASTRDGNDVEAEGAQHDIERILITGPLNNGFGLRQDAVGNTIASATAVSLVTTNGITEGNATGIIEQQADVDYFRVNHTGGNLTIELLAAEFRGMLNPAFEVRNASNQVLLTAVSNNASDGVGEVAHLQNLNAGTYYISVRGMNTYGDVGQYRLNLRVGTPLTGYNDTLASATNVGIHGHLGSTGFAGTLVHQDSVGTNDPIDFFKFRTDPHTRSLSFRLSGQSQAAGLTIYHDQNGDGVITASEALFVGTPGTSEQSYSVFNVAGSQTYYARVLRGPSTALANYTLRVGSDVAPSAAAPEGTPQAFDPGPLHGQRIVYDSIDSTMGDTIDYYRLTAAENGRFKLTAYLNEGNLRIEVGIDANRNNLLDAGEITHVSSSTGWEQIENIPVIGGQTLLVRITPRSSPTFSNYMLEAIADYAVGGDGVSLAGVKDMSHRAAASLVEHLGDSDAYDTFKLNPMPGVFTAGFTALGLSANHRLFIIRDLNNNGVIDPGEASGNAGSGQQISVTAVAGVTYYLQVRSVLVGEFYSVGNYRLTYATAGAVTGATFADPVALAPPSPTPQTTPPGYLGYDPDNASLTNLIDHYQFTLTSATRFDVASSDAQVGLQIGRVLPSSTYDRIAGPPRYAGLVTSLSVTLQPGTYQLRAYRHAGEREADAFGGNYTLTYRTAAITDNVAPTITSARFEFDQAPNALVYTFSEDVGASIDKYDVYVETLDQSYDFPIAEVRYDPINFRAMYLFHGGVLPEGEYAAWLGGTAVRDASGNPMAGVHSMQFHVLYGDANRDRRVDFDDLLITAQNYGETNRRFSQGNFNYTRDGTVNFDDLLILAQRYGYSMSTQALVPPRVLRIASGRISDDVLKEPSAH